MSALRRDRDRQRRRRRHARPPARALGQADPAARARRLAPARAAELARGGRLRRQPLRLAGHLVRRRAARRSSRRSTTSSAARRSSTARRSTACARRTSASCATTTASRPRGRSATTSSSPTTRRPSSSTRCTARAARTRPSRPRARPTRSRRSRHEPRIQQLSDDLAAAGLHPFHAPCGVMLDEANMPYSRCVRCADVRRLPVPGARQVRRRGAGRAAGARAPQRHAAHQRAGAARCETNAAGHARSPRSSSSATASRRRSPADIVVVSCGAANSATLLLASASDTHPNGLANGSDQVGRNYMFHNSQAVLALSKEENPTVFQKTLGLNDFYFGERRLRVPAGQHPDGRQVLRPPMYRGEKPLRDEARAAVDARPDRPPRGRLLALDRGPAAARQPRHAATATAASRSSYTADQPGARRSGCYDELKSMLGHLGMHEDHLFPRHAYLKNDIPVAGVRAPGRAPAASAPTRPRRCSTPTAGARGRQPLRRRHELLPEHRRRQPGADGDGQRAARRRSPARAAGRREPARSRRCRLRPRTARRVVIVGGGFGGLAAAQALRSADVDVTLVDRTNHHLFQPLLYQVAAGVLSMGDCAPPIRGMLRAQSERQRARWPRSPTSTPSGARCPRPRRADRLRQPDRRLRRARPPTSATTSGRSASFGLKTLARRGRAARPDLSALRGGRAGDGPTLRAELLTFVVIGGGPTGVEVAGAARGRSRATTCSGEFTRFDPTTGARRPARRRRARADRLQPEALGEGRARAGRARRRRCARARAPRRSTPRRRRSSRAATTRADRGAHGDLGGRRARGAVRRRRSPRRPAPSTTAAAGSRSAARLTVCRAIRRSR